MIDTQRATVFMSVVICLSGCQLFNPIPTAVQQGGSDVMLSCRTWHVTGELESELILGREGLSQYPQGVEITIQDPSPCVGLILTIPEVAQGDAILTQLTLEQRAAAMADLLALIGALQ